MIRAPANPQRDREGFVKKKVPEMLKKAVLILLALGFGRQVSAQDGDLLARFKGGIGVIPVSGPSGAVNLDGTFPNVTRNIVRGVVPSGQIWRIADLRADVFTDGRIKVRGRGLLLGGGNSIGQTANLSVFATLICEPPPQSIERNTTTSGVPLDPNGDFRIDDVLNPPPVDCASPVLLIRATNGAWLAAGFPKFGDEN
jgi:hypothetical protein